MLNQKVSEKLHKIYYNQQGERISYSEKNSPDLKFELNHYTDKFSVTSEFRGEQDHKYLPIKMFVSFVYGWGNSYNSKSELYGLQVVNYATKEECIIGHKKLIETYENFFTHGKKLRSKYSHTFKNSICFVVDLNTVNNHLMRETKQYSTVIEDAENICVDLSVINFVTYVSEEKKFYTYERLYDRFVEYNKVFISDDILFAFKSLEANTTSFDYMDYYDINGEQITLLDQRRNIKRFPDRFSLNDKIGHYIISTLYFGWKFWPIGPFRKYHTLVVDENNQKPVEANSGLDCRNYETEEEAIQGHKEFIEKYQKIIEVENHQ